MTQPCDPPRDGPASGQSSQARRRWMAVLARADGAAIARHLESCPVLPGYTRLRGPESGLVMVRGRAGGGGAAFNLGEMTVTRCTVQTSDGQVGHAYVAGRDERQAELAAVVDALMQDAERAPILEARVIAPLEAAQQNARTEREAKAAATKVQFFAMQTMRT
jgi:alpha-D-ribose 1-methylphosphonate 5-triphosphate synthase subunit PhnG